MTFLPISGSSKKDEVEGLKAALPLSELKKGLSDLPPLRDFEGALRGPGISLIAEVKKSSPSAGSITCDFDPSALVSAYRAGGARAISVLTDKNYFGGSLEHLAAARASVPLPVLRKDFIVDEYQIYESRRAGADAILLIAEMLSEDKLAAFLELASGLGLATLTEAHSTGELEKAISAGAKIIGINNRDLKTFRVDLKTSLDLLPLIPENRLKVSESGIKTADQVEELAHAGADAILVGETLMRSKNAAAKIEELLQNHQN